MKIKPIIFLVLAVALLGGLFFAFKPQKQVQNPPANQDVVPVITESKAKTFELVVKSKKLVSGPETIKVTEGDEVVIKITSDEPEELHLHGYDKSVDLEKNIEAQLSFTANLTGRFPYELEKSKTDIGALEVLPR